QSTYNDLVVYQRTQNEWEQAYTLAGFSSPARFLELDHLGNIWLGHAIKGVYRLQPNIQFNSVEQVREIGVAEGLPSNNNRVFKLDTRIMSSYSDTLYQWDAIDEEFIPFTDLHEHFTEKGTVANILATDGEKYWVVTPNELN